MWHFLLFSALVFLMSIPVQFFLDSLFIGVILAPTSSELFNSGHSRSSLQRMNGAVAGAGIDLADVMEALRRQSQSRLFDNFIKAPLHIRVARETMEAAVRKDPQIKQHFMALTSSREKERSLSEMKRDILSYRMSIIEPKARAQFDGEWDIITTHGQDPEFSDVGLSQMEGQLKECFEGVDELLNVMLEATKEAAGAMILRQFFADLLGEMTLAAQILQRQFQCSDVKKEMLVNWLLKAIAIAFITAADLFMMYTCVLYAFKKGHQWQYKWLLNVTFYMMATVFFYDLVTVLVINYAIPRLISTEEQSVEDEVRLLVRKICFQDMEIHENQVDGDKLLKPGVAIDQAAGSQADKAGHNNQLLAETPKIDDSEFPPAFSASDFYFKSTVCGMCFHIIVC